jgi:hypothetical protein
MMVNVQVAICYEVHNRKYEIQYELVTWCYAENIWKLPCEVATCAPI